MRWHFATALVVALGAIACAAPHDPTVGACEIPAARVVRPSLASDPARVIIHFARDFDLASLAANGRAGRAHLIAELQLAADRSQARALALLRARGIAPTAVLWSINAVAATIPASLVEELVALSEVERIEPEVPLRIPITNRSRGTALPWNLTAVRAPELWAAGTRGDGIVVAVLDSGVDAEHPDLAGGWRGSAGWFDPYTEHATPFDGDGHGTQVAGLVVGGDSSGTPVGVAPAAQWIAARIYDDTGTASLAAIHLVLQWVLDPDGNPATDDAADVIIAPWGYSELVDDCFLELEPDLAVLRAAQIAPVFAAGNSGPVLASSISPANNPSAFAVGAIDQQLAVIGSSGRGPDACTHSIFPELVAPGDGVRTTDRTLGGQFPSSYVVVSGTSFAAPHVAGAMALLRAAHPAATVAQLEDALTATAIDLMPMGADNASGFGLLDVVAAEARLAGRVATCNDDDQDGYYAEPSCGSAVDCNDVDPAIHPDACDAPEDRVDQDCDGGDR